VVAVTVIPGRGDYAREQGWVEGPGTPDPGAIAERLGRQVRAVAPAAEFRSQQVRGRVDRAEIVRRLRTVARETGASTVFLGSENVGRIAKPISSIGSNVAARTDYDIYLVQRPDPAFESGSESDTGSGADTDSGAGSE
jgi:hypothetical protein